ncbi:3-keto-5-aminohexanoate cleavage protein [Phreatobacter stygius]|uniref:3-keto-5-aminohexanoate cleavage protein n=1 Tax=Phreatobacter stygius TaxID=1940610 RepID=UPI001476CD6B|nr:3-keto-5-aminohexanoate cleavage protein [Phreatobacter stygius]
MTPSQPLVITAALTGGAPRKGPAHPVTPEAVMADAIAAWRAGAAIVHLHARTADGGTTMAPAAYRSMVTAIRHGGCEAVIDLSAGDDGGKADHAARLAVIESGGELVTLACGPFNLGGRLYDNSPGFVDRMAQAIAATASKPILEVFDTGQMATLNRLLAEGALVPPVMVEFVMGVPGGMPVDLKLLPVLIERLPAGALWSISIQTHDPVAFRAIQRQVILHGGHVRTGLEDHVFDAKGGPVAGNAALVAEAVVVARSLGREIATADQARRLLGLPALPSVDVQPRHGSGANRDRGA